VERNDKKKASRRMTANASKERATSPAPKARPGGAAADGMSPALQAHIGRQVRAMFDEVAEEPIPDHLLRLLKELDQSGEK
jgi:Anti-sigma factor NepR